MAKQDNMIQRQKAYSEEKVAYAKEVVDSMVDNGEAVTPYSVWRKSRLSKSFIYSNKEVADYIEKHRCEKKYNYRKYTTEDVREEYIEQLEKENAMLRKELAQYKQETLESLMNENQILKYRLQKFEILAKDGIIETPDDTKN